MKKIVTMIRPFSMEQTLMVYEDGNKIDIAKTTLEDLYPNVFALMEKHDTYQLDLVGPKSYTKGLKNQIETAAIAKYESNKIEINII